MKIELSGLPGLCMTCCAAELTAGCNASAPSTASEAIPALTPISLNGCNPRTHQLNQSLGIRVLACAAHA